MTSTTTEYHSPLTQAEKLRETKQDLKARDQGPATFKDFAERFANETRGGRFAKSGSDQKVQPLPSGPWSVQPGPGDERPLGYDINQVPDLGFPLNQQASVAPTPAVLPSAVETATDRGGTSLSPDGPAPPLSSEDPQKRGDGPLMAGSER